VASRWPASPQFAALTLGQINSAAGLALAALTWLVVALAGYFALWWR
jgi:hypothetical protein